MKLFRYRGYVYDTETKLYYLQSRYYDPEMGRFINADAFVTTGQGLLGNNMFAYCGNNAPNYYDPAGNMMVSVVQERNLGVATGGTGVLGLLYPFVWLADIIAGVLKGKTESEEKEKVIADAKVASTEPSDVIIYRYYATKTENLAPRIGKDFDGLSFSTKPPRDGVKAVATTINTVNATGILCAVKNGSSHVVVFPKIGSVMMWMAQGHDSIWTKTLSAIVWEIEG